MHWLALHGGKKPGDAGQGANLSTGAERGDGSMCPPFSTAVEWGRGWR